MSLEKWSCLQHLQSWFRSGVDEHSMSWKSASWLNDNSRTALSQVMEFLDCLFRQLLPWHFYVPIAQLSWLLAVILLLWRPLVVLVNPVSGNQVLICSDFPSTLVNHLEMCWLFHGYISQLYPGITCVHCGLLLTSCFFFNSLRGHNLALKFEYFSRVILWSVW